MNTLTPTLIFKRTLLLLAGLLVLTTIPVLAREKNVTQLSLGQPIERQLKSGEFHSYSIALEAGQFLNDVVEQKTIDVVVTLFDPR